MTVTPSLHSTVVLKTLRDLEDHRATRQRPEPE